ncbi:MAG: hypothetical protein K9W42_04140 [Candidatus Heimdallarchaeota archaeon]|nr:hypothetical protein [Candidatus Heimdallarchaeota archaeon]
MTGDSDYKSNIAFGNNLAFTINKTSGLIYGFGQRGWVRGSIDDKKVKTSMNIKYEIMGYNLPAYKLGRFRDFTKNNRLAAILVPSISMPIIAGMIVIIVKRNNQK